MAKLFVSYSRKDSVAARKLINSLKEMDQDVWVDWEDIPPAVDWMDQIFRGIEGSDAFIFLVSPDSAVSEVCNVEVGQAAKNNKRIIPVVVRDVDRRAIKVNPVIGELNWIFAREQDLYEEVLIRTRTAIEPRRRPGPGPGRSPSPGPSWGGGCRGDLHASTDRCAPR